MVNVKSFPNLVKEIWEKCIIKNCLVLFKDLAIIRDAKRISDL